MSNEKLKRDLIEKHIGRMSQLEKASVEYFLSTGKVNGSFMLRLKNMMDDLAKSITDMSLLTAREKLLVEALKEAKAYLVIHHDETEALLVIQQAEEALQQYAGEGGEKA